MDIKQFAELLQTKFPEHTVLLNQELKNYTTFKIGGPADIIVKPTTCEAIKDIIKLCQSYKVPYYILGNGSNLLAQDEGYRGVIIQIANQLGEVQVQGNQVIAQAGALLSKVATKAMENGLTGLEFAHGIPGTIGGAIVMNAGAYGGEMKQVVTACKVLDPNGNIKILSLEELELGYRSSVIERKGYIVLEVVMQLKPGDQTVIWEKMKELLARRKEKQPLDKPSAGSTFKRPEGYFAGKLIMDSNLQGCQIGGARISDKHCGFVVNTGEATCKDVEALIEHVQQVVEEKFNVKLETEVKKLR